MKTGNGRQKRSRSPDCPLVHRQFGEPDVRISKSLAFGPLAAESFSKYVSSCLVHTGVLLYKQTEPKDSPMSRNRDQTQTNPMLFLEVFFSQCFIWRYFIDLFFLCSFFTNLLLLHSGFWFWFYGFLCVKRVLWGVWMCFLFFLFDSFFSVCFILSLFVFILSYFIIWNPYMCYSDRIFFKKKGIWILGRREDLSKVMIGKTIMKLLEVKNYFQWKKKLYHHFSNHCYSNFQY